MSKFTLKAKSAKKDAELAEAQLLVDGAAPQRLSLAEQWTKLTGVVLRALGKVQHARELQAAAAQQVDLAAYAFQGIVDELSTVMTLPSRREPAVVHLFEPSAQRPILRGSLAA